MKCIKNPEGLPTVVPFTGRRKLPTALKLGSSIGMDAPKENCDFVEDISEFLRPTPVSGGPHVKTRRPAQNVFNQKKNDEASRRSPRKICTRCLFA